MHTFVFANDAVDVTIPKVTMTLPMRARRMSPDDSIGEAAFAGRAPVNTDWKSRQQNFVIDTDDKELSTLAR